MGRLILVLGTSSGSGKSTITVALCRILADAGYRVAPFKAVNMSRNSVSLGDGSEIARAQWLQAQAARTEPLKEMNPVLLKPETDGNSQVIVNGRSLGSFSVRDYQKIVRDQGKGVVSSSLERLLSSNDVVVAEGAGSPSEINLRREDLSNSYLLSNYDPYALLVADIERGGVFASLLGTLELMVNPDKVGGIIINKMMGDEGILRPGIEEIEKRTGKKVIGIVPHLGNIPLPGEDSMDYAREPLVNRKVCVVKYPMMENYSDLDPLVAYGIGFTYVTADNMDLLNSCDLVILPGSKNVLADMNFLKESGLWERIRGAGKILGICGGFQMLSEKIRDPEMVQSPLQSYEGLGLLKCTFTYRSAKTTKAVSYEINNPHFRCGMEKGYEIHYGELTDSGEKPLCLVDGKGEGAISVDGRIIGTNIHGILENPCFLGYILNVNPEERYSEILNRNIDRLAKNILEKVDVSGILSFVSSGN
ncbi:MAG: cobyric acid synthase [Thermoplasmata archaeon]